MGKKLASRASLRAAIVYQYRWAGSVNNGLFDPKLGQSRRLTPIGSLGNHDDNGNKNPTNLHIWQWKTVFLHALHVHFSSLTFWRRSRSFYDVCEMTSFPVVWTTWAYDDKCSILSSYVPRAGSNLIPGWSEHNFQAKWLWIIEKWLQKREVIISDDVLASVDVVFA